MSTPKRPRARREKHYCVPESVLKECVQVFRDCLHERYRGAKPRSDDELAWAMQSLQELMEE